MSSGAGDRASEGPEGPDAGDDSAHAESNPFAPEQAAVGGPRSAGPPYTPSDIAQAAIADARRLRAAAPAPFQGPVEHSRMELQWVRRLVARLVYVRYASGSLATAALSVPDQEVAEYLGWDTADIGPLLPLEDAIEVARDLIDRSVELTNAQGVELRLPEFAHTWKLSPLETRIVVALAARELDPRCARAYCYAWNDFKRPLPTVGFVAELLGWRGSDSFDEVVRHLLPSSTLVRCGLVVLSEPDDDEELPVLERSVQVAQRVVLHLVGVDDIDERLRHVCALQESSGQADDLVMRPDAREKVSNALGARRTSGPARVLLVGPPGTGKKSMVACHAKALGQRLLVIDMARVRQAGERLRNLLARALREAVLQDALPVLEWREGAAFEDTPAWQVAAIGDVVNAHPGTLVITASERPDWLLPTVDRLAEVTAPFPTAEERHELWKRALPQKSYLAKSADLKEIAFQFTLSGGGIFQAAARTLEAAKARSRKQPRIRFVDLAESCTAQVQHRLSTLARRVATGFTWADMVLQRDTRERLEEMLTFARHKRFIMGEWGFRSKVPYGAGLSSLFSGPPGTGKTMAASIMSRELGMELFRIDLSRVVNKYIGETEKNLGRIFDEAQQSNAILLFDEADSLFSKRTDVRSSVDRYANLEVNYLLQRMEDFDGVTILTTNMEASLDDAFKRRLKFHIDFPFPDADARAKLWRVTIPSQAELEAGVDWRKLAEGYDLSGGHIKNAVLRAAILAAAEGSGIGFRHLQQAARAEYREMGKLVLG